MKSTKAAIGIDIGGTNTKIGIVTKEGQVLAYHHFPSRAQESFEAFIEDLKKNFKKLTAKLSGQVELFGTGIGAPDVNVFTGEMEEAANFSWEEPVPLVKEVSDLFGLPAVADNDANAAALGEMYYGVAKEMKDFVVLTLGTGLGSGIVVNRKLVYGYTGMAGELGHTSVRPGGRKCNCGLSGCLETYVSVTGVRRTAFKMMADMKAPSSLRNVSYDELTGNMIAEAALQGDPIAMETFAYTGSILGTKMADLVAILSPEAIILAGGLTKAANLLLIPTISSMEQQLFPAYRNKVKVLFTAVDSANAAVMGAGALAWVNFQDRDDITPKKIAKPSRKKTQKV